MTTPVNLQTPSVTVGNKKYPMGGEQAANALTELVSDTVRATGRLSQNDELRLRRMISARFRDRYRDYGDLVGALGDYVISFGDIPEAAGYLSVTPGFRRGAIVFRVKPDLAKLKNLLDLYPNVVAVIDGVAPKTIASFGLASRAVVVSADKHAGVCMEIMRRLSGMPSLMAVNGVSAPSIYQTPQERGDMHDIRPLLLLDKKQTVTVCVSDLDTWGDAAEILNYYLGFEDRVSVTFTDVPERDKARGVLRATDATRRLLELALAGDISSQLAEATAGPVKFPETEAQAYISDLQQHGWGSPQKLTKQLVIVNFRDSGHVASPVREVSHPELDTGVAGFGQLMALAAKKGIAVPMGHRGDLTSDRGPNLLEYWKWPCCQEISGQPRRLREYRLLYFIAKQFGVKVTALALRSGSTDALSYCGISLISVDLALEGADRGEAIAKGLVRIRDDGELAYPFGHPGSWRRAIKRLLIVPKVFHQAYIAHLRDDNGAIDPDWPGKFHPDDLAAIEQAYDLYITKADHAVLPPNSPLGIASFAKALTLFYDPDLAASFESNVDSDGFKKQESKKEEKERRQAKKAVREANEELSDLVRLMQENKARLQ